MAQPAQQIHVRLPAELVSRIDDRAQRVGLSRNAWFEKALEWALSQPVRVWTVETKERV